MPVRMLNAPTLLFSVLNRLFDRGFRVPWSRHRQILRLTVDKCQANLVFLQIPRKRATEQGFFQFVQCGEFALVDGGKALSFIAESIEFGHDFFLYRDRWKGKSLVLKRSHVDVCLGAPLSQSLKAGFEGLEKVFDEAYVRLLWIRNDANNAIRKAGIEAQNGSFSNICGDGYTDRSLWPEPALGQSGLAVGL